MKKFFAFIAAFGMMIVMVACGNSSSCESVNDADSTEVVAADSFATDVVADTLAVETEVVDVEVAE